MAEEKKEELTLKIVLEDCIAWLESIRDEKDLNEEVKKRHDVKTIDGKYFIGVITKAIPIAKENIDKLNGQENVKANAEIEKLMKEITSLLNEDGMSLKVGAMIFARFIDEVSFEKQFNQGTGIKFTRGSTGKKWTLNKATQKPKEEPKKEETKKEEPKAETKKEETKKEEPKPEQNKEEPKSELKKEESKQEPKKEEPKQEPKQEPKKEEPKPAIIHISTQQTTKINSNNIAPIKQQNNLTEDEEETEQEIEQEQTKVTNTKENNNFFKELFNNPLILAMMFSNGFDLQDARDLSLSNSVEDACEKIISKQRIINIFPISTISGVNMIPVNPCCCIQPQVLPIIPVMPQQFNYVPMVMQYSTMLPFLQQQMILTNSLNHSQEKKDFVSQNNSMNDMLNMLLMSNMLFSDKSKKIVL